MDVITAADRASYLRDPSLETDASLIQVVDLVNALLTEKWATPVTPAPVEVTLLALSIGARAWINNPALANVESTSVSVDDGATTERYRSGGRAGVYLTSDEVALLNGERRTRSVRLVAYGETS